MKNRKLVRRVVLSAAVSTASWIAATDSNAFGLESSAKPSAYGLQPVQHQPGTGTQGSAGANATVTAELKRMFEENGQEMPSMNPKELPNAQGQQANMIRPTNRLQAGIPQASAAQASRPQPTSKNFLQKFIGKITGKDKKATEAAVVPPVPPGFKEPAPAPPSGGQNTSQMPNARQTVPGQPTATLARPSAVTSAQNGHQSPIPPRVAPVRTAQSGQGSGQVRTASQPAQPVPAVPIVSGGVRPPLNAASQEGISKNPQYVQPGTAPGFMPSSQARSIPAEQTAAPPLPKPSANFNSEASNPALAIPKVDDGFESPFTEPEVAADAAEALDLDSLMPRQDLPAASTKLSATAEPAKPAPATVADVPEQNPVSDKVAESGNPEAVRNPLTGVRLNDSDEELFDPNMDLTPSVQPALSAAKEGSGGAESFGKPGPPMDDFGNSLPAIELPAVEDLEPAAEAEVAGPMDLGFPELEAQDAAEATQNIPATQLPVAQIPAADTTTTTPAAEAAVPPAETAETAPKPLQSVDTERLQQTAEKERRSRQMRMIQSRPGQMGFKGFCPVELRDRRELTETNPEFVATFGLQTYTFSSLAAKAAFEADPSRYAPAAGGSDVVLLVNSGEEQPGMLDYALWYRDRLYLFRSRETMNMFNKDPLRFANQY